MVAKEGTLQGHEQEMADAPKRVSDKHVTTFPTHSFYEADFISHGLGGRCFSVSRSNGPSVRAMEGKWSISSAPSYVYTCALRIYARDPALYYIGPSKVRSPMQTSISRAILAPDICKACEADY